MCRTQLRASSHGPGWLGDLGNPGSLPSHEHIENVTRDLKVSWRDLGNGPAWPRPYEEALNKLDFGVISDSDSASCVEPKLSATDSVELNAFTAVLNWFRRRSFAVLYSSVRFGTLEERHLSQALYDDIIINYHSYSAINVFEETGFSGAEPFFKVQESFALRNCVRVVDVWHSSNEASFFLTGKSSSFHTATFSCWYFH